VVNDRHSAEQVQEMTQLLIAAEKHMALANSERGKAEEKRIEL
jgi:hypothetical protein